MYRTLKLTAALALLAVLSGCSTVGAILETTVEIAVGAAELILNDELESSQFTPSHIYPTLDR